MSIHTKDYVTLVNFPYRSLILCGIRLIQQLLLALRYTGRNEAKLNNLNKQCKVSFADKQYLQHALLKKIFFGCPCTNYKRIMSWFISWRFLKKLMSDLDISCKFHNNFELSVEQTSSRELIYELKLKQRLVFRFYTSYHVIYHNITLNLYLNTSKLDGGYRT